MFLLLEKDIMRITIDLDQFVSSAIMNMRSYCTTFLVIRHPGNPPHQTEPVGSFFSVLWCRVPPGEPLNGKQRPAMSHN